MEHFASVKKQPGKLNVNEHQIEWIPANGSRSTIPFEKISGMKATAPTAAVSRILLTGENNAMLLKIDFASRNALEAARDDIQKAIQACRSRNTEASVKPERSSSASGGAQKSNGSATLPGSVATTTTTKSPSSSLSSSSAQEPAASAKSGSKTAKKKTISLDADKLLQNLALQRKVLESDANLRKVFQEVVMSGSLSNEQFWSTRLEMLVIEAQAQSQSRGAYNVLSTVKPKTGSDNRINLSLTREKIRDIFDQHPIVRKAYNENVPEISESEFWQRFFMSQLFLTLRGEKISRNQPFDSVIDRYIAILHESLKRQNQHGSTLPIYLDVGANEYDVPGRSTNHPDMTMKFSLEKQSIPSLIKSMNGLSGQLLRGKLPRKSTATKQTTPAVEDAQLDAQIKLHDLELNAESDVGVPLNIDQPTQAQLDAAEDEEMNVYIDPLVFAQNLALPLNLGEQANNEVLVMKSLPAMERINQLVQENASYADDTHKDKEIAFDNEELVFAHATTLEFLSHFWKAKLSRSPVDAFGAIFEKCLLRLQAVIDQAQPNNDGIIASLSPLFDSIHRAQALLI